jgi:hypothetical protein
MAKSLVWLIIWREEGAEERRGKGRSKYPPLNYAINHALTTRATFFPFIVYELKGSHFIT